MTVEIKTAFFYHLLSTAGLWPLLHGPHMLPNPQCREHTYSAILESMLLPFLPVFLILLGSFMFGKTALFWKWNLSWNISRKAFKLIDLSNLKNHLCILFYTWFHFRFETPKKRLLTEPCKTMPLNQAIIILYHGHICDFLHVIFKIIFWNH